MGELLGPEVPPKKGLETQLTNKFLNSMQDYIQIRTNPYGTIPIRPYNQPYYEAMYLFPNFIVIQAKKDGE